NVLTAWAGPWGISYGANLTPDKPGIGAWTADLFIKTMRTGKHLGVGRQILPPMPWQQIGRLTDRDLRAEYTYLRSFTPIENLEQMRQEPETGHVGEGVNRLHLAKTHAWRIELRRARDHRPIVLG